MFSSDLKQLLIIWVSSNLLIYSSENNIPNEAAHYDENQAVKNEGINYAPSNADLKAYINSDGQTDETTLSADCNCGTNGKCVVENGRNACKCQSEYGSAEWKSKVECKACECGKDSNCTFDPDFWGGNKKCICKTGYVEKNGSCSGPCLKNPCLNGGTCSIVYRVMKCKCKDNFTGERCEKPKEDPCTKNPCQNGGTCSVVGESFSCKCNSPYTGDKCETSPCTKNPCQNNGTCSVVGESFSCKCKSPYSGNKCETSPCIKNLCQNNGTCSVVGESISCKCKSPYSGDKCETNICDSQKCFNGVCVADGRNFKCLCNEGYTGLLCDRMKIQSKETLRFWIPIVVGTNAVTLLLLLGTCICLCRSRRSKQNNV